ncbi:DUF4864 domain-containing protein [Palleronia pelagia]|uniref:DUF4864 domain-containing protein n=1 Tax=Palleronia pelagia TaxID=387096 RepID=A0A1H8LQI1_9RHOB|nr:DUF4864 domain-containing protein [Palleronia pelagia]SEO07381.1 protein of unknown function [Palleronia pelagia]
MKPLFTACLAAALVVPVVAPAEDAAIEGVISAQIDAFRADDFATAFTYASPMIKGMFGTPERFGQMVQQGYPMVYRPEDVTFLDARPLGDRVQQRVMMRDTGGALHVLEYEMIETADGWQINGVRLLRAPQVGA